MMNTRSFRLPSWMRALSIVVGVISLIAGITVLVFPTIGVLLLVAILSVGLIFMGAERIAIGVSGRTYEVLVPATAVEKREATSTVR